MFQQEPPNRKEACNLEIMRTGARGKWGGYILSAKMFGLPIHFYGRSIPCTQKAGCPICAADNKPRWTGYLPVWTPGMIRPALIELPTAAAETVRDYQTKYATLRGRLINCTRPRGKANSRIKVELTSPNNEGLSLPSVPEVRQALCLIWRLDFDNMTSDLSDQMDELKRYREQTEHLDGTPEAQPV